MWVSIFFYIHDSFRPMLKQTSFINSQYTYIYQKHLWNIFSGILMYRMFRNERKRKLKLLHAGIMIAVFLSAVIALKAVFDSHNLNPCKHPSTEGDICALPNLYSLHSWLGLLTVILFLFQVMQFRMNIYHTFFVPYKIAVFKPLKKEMFP